MSAERNPELYRWDPVNEQIAGSFYMRDRVITPTLAIERVLSTCKSFLKPGWESVEAYFLDYHGMISSLSPFVSTELSFVFENPNKLALKTKYELTDLEDVLTCPPTSLNSSYLVVDYDWSLSTQASSQINEALIATPYRCLEIGVGFNRLLNERLEKRFYQTGVLVLEVVLEDARIAVAEHQKKIEDIQKKLRYAEEQLAILKPIAPRTEELFPKLD